MLREIIFVILILLCRGYMNPRLQNVFNELRQSRFLPKASATGIGGGEQRYPGPHPRRYAHQADRWMPAEPYFDNTAAGVYSGSGEPHPHPHSQPLRQAQDEETSEDSNFDNTYFCPLPGMAQERATLAQEDLYPWVARVVHAPFNNTIMAPLICTAAVIAQRILITAAKCIATAKADYTTVILLKLKLGVKAFVFPAEPSKQMFDDVGFIVTWRFNISDDHFKSITLTSKKRVNDNSFNFFEQWAIKNSTIVGFIAPDDSPGTHTLYKLENMHASNRVCNEIYPAMKNSTDYWAPCVHSCSPEDHNMTSETCGRYLFGLGHMVVDADTNELIGIVTWTCSNSARDRLSRNGLPMPLGLAVPNRYTSILDLNCSMEIRQTRFGHGALQPGLHRKQCSKYY